MFGTNVFSAQGAGNAVVNAGLGGHVQVVAYDATKDAIESLNKGVVTLVLAQKPFDMGYMAVQFAAADAAGVTSLPKRVETGFAIIDKDNVNDPETRALHLPGARQLGPRSPVRRAPRRRSPVPSILSRLARPLANR